MQWVIFDFNKSFNLYFLHCSLVKIILLYFDFYFLESFDFYFYLLLIEIIWLFFEFDFYLLEKVLDILDMRFSFSVRFFSN